MAGRTFSLDPRAMIRGKGIIGSSGYRHTLLPGLLDLMARTQDRIPFDRMVSDRFPLDQVNVAMDAAEWGEREDDGHPGRADALTMAMDQGHVLAIDVGTSATRVSAVSLSGTILATSRKLSPVDTNGDVAVLDPATLWADIQSLIRDVAQQVGPPIAIGVACQLDTVAVDSALEPVTPIWTWQDRRTYSRACRGRTRVDRRLRILRACSGLDVAGMTHVSADR